MAFMEEFQHLKIKLEDIKSATGNFEDNKVIGCGGFGKVYKGELSHFKGRSMVAIKRLDRKYGQGDPEFWKEIMMLTRYTHPNLISLVGYCDESDEKILVYEHASNGSLDRHLSSTSLTWAQRLKICIDASRGLSYLHDDKGTQQRVLHRDIKSSNILLDENWNAKVSDMGLSKIGPANQQHTALVTNVVGTLGYLDPLYMELGVLTKESDVYSFGVVLFEVLCGRLCFENSNGRFPTLVRKWKQSYKQKKLDEIIFQAMAQQLDPTCLEMFSDVAFQCLQKSREERPTMAHVIEKLEIALQFQEIYEEVEEPMEYEEMAKTAVPPLNYKSEEELRMLLSKGVLLNGGNMWFSINKNGEHQVMISADKCLIPVATADDNNQFVSVTNSRFAMDRYQVSNGKFEVHARSQFLSPQVTYTVNLVFKFLYGNKEYLFKQRYIALKYKLRGEARSSVAYLGGSRDDGWLMAELYQFTSDRRNVNLEILFEGPLDPIPINIVVEGIEFCPLEKVEHQVVEDDEQMDMQSTTYSDTDWELKLPNDYQDIIKWSKDSVQWTTKKELYLLLCKGFLIDNGKKWFFTKNGKKCYMLTAREALLETQWRWMSLPESRFQEVAYYPNPSFKITCKIKGRILSPETKYGCYLVYNLSGSYQQFEAPVRVKQIDDKWRQTDLGYIYLVSPQTPVIRPKIDQNTHNPTNKSNAKSLPQPRDDGWMEVRFCEFQTDTNNEIISMFVIIESSYMKSLHGVILQGIEFKPI